MNLTADTFLQIIKSLRSDSASGAGREQRKMPRVGVRGKSSIMMPAKTGSRVFPVSVRDISANGIGLLMTEPLVAVGEDFVLMLPSGGQQGKRQMLCGVCRFNRLSANLYSVGASFKREVAESAGSSDAVAKAISNPVKHSGVQPVTKELLDSADQATVSALEERLRRLSA